MLRPPLLEFPYQGRFEDIWTVLRGLAATDFALSPMASLTHPVPLDWLLLVAQAEASSVPSPIALLLGELEPISPPLGGFGPSSPYSMCSLRRLFALCGPGRGTVIFSQLHVHTCWAGIC